MNPLNDLDNQLQLPQLLLLLVFLAAYVAAIGRMFGARGWTRAVVVAALSAVGLGIVIEPWTLAALLVVGSIAAVGAFALAATLVSRGLEAGVLQLSRRRSAGPVRAVPPYRSAG